MGMLILDHHFIKLFDMLRRLCQIIIFTIGNIEVDFNPWKKSLFV